MFLPTISTASSRARRIASSPLPGAGACSFRCQVSGVGWNFSCSTVCRPGFINGLSQDSQERERERETARGREAGKERILKTTL